jgi:hypothetical protein
MGTGIEMTDGAKHEIDDTVLKSLRQIGWDHWNPIEIRLFNDVDWRRGAADEYDTYMCEAYRRSVAGEAADAVAFYLDGVVEHNMSFGTPTPEVHASSLKTALAIRKLIVGGDGGYPTTDGTPVSSIGSSFQSFLEEEGIAEECNAAALQKLAVLRETCS